MKTKKDWTNRQLFQGIAIPFLIITILIIFLISIIVGKGVIDNKMVEMKEEEFKMVEVTHDNCVYLFHGSNFIHKGNCPNH